MSSRHRIMTEYQRSFKPSRFICATTTYRNNLEFRLEQQHRFQSHVTAPFQWEDESDSEEGSGCDPCCECGGRGRRAFVPEHRYKHEKWNRLYEERIARSDGEQRHGVNDEDEVGERGVESEEERERESQSSDSDDGDSIVHVVEPVRRCAETRRRIQDKQTQTPCCWEECEHKSPFAPYGYGVETKKTFNVKAASEVHPSALRAKHIRDATRHDAAHCDCCIEPSAVTSAARLAPTTPILIRPDRPASAEWETEYDREFRPYDQSKYRVRAGNIRPTHGNDLMPSQPRSHRSYLTVWD